MVPSAVDIFGLEPRYHLRSGFSGLQLRQLAEPKVNISLLSIEMITIVYFF